MAGEDLATSSTEVEDVPPHPSRKVSEDGLLLQEDKEMAAMYANAAAATGK